MIETHVTNLLLRSEFRSSTGFEILDFLNGIIAPAFLFAAGFGAMMSISRGNGAVLSGRILRRIGWIWILGYFLRLPGYSVPALLSANHTAWAEFFAVDILHCIAAGVLLLRALCLIPVKHPTRTGLHVIVALLIVIVSSSGVLNPLADSMPTAIGAYFSAALSPFPVFPWIAYIFVGAGIANVVLSRSQEEYGALFRSLGRIGIFLVALTVGILYMFLDLIRIPWHVNPLAIALFTGALLAIISIAHKPVSVVGLNHVRRVLLRLSRRSLAVYAIHILILYRIPIGSSTIQELWGTSLTPMGVFVGVAGLSIVMLTITYIGEGRVALMRYMRRHVLRTDKSLGHAAS